MGAEEGQHDQAAQARRQREAALQALAETREPAIQAPKRSSRLRIGIALVVVCLILSGVGLLLHRPSAPTSKPVVRDPLVITFAGKGIACPSDAAWSPDGKRIAVLGYAACGVNGPAHGGLLVLYDAATGARVKTISLDSLITAQVIPPSVQQDQTQMGQVSLGYFNLLWAPDGKHLGLLFDASSYEPGTSSASQPTTRDFGGGLLLIGATDGQAQIHVQPGFFQAYQAAQSAAFTTVGSVSTLRWNIQAGTMTPVHLPSALGYQWRDDGSLQPQQILGPSPKASPPAAQIAPIGNPLGGTEFSIWQHGVVTYASDSCADGQTRNTPSKAHTYYLFGDTFSAWSPDGRYLYLFVGAIGRLATPAPPPPATSANESASCYTLGPATKWLQLPIRDAAISSVLSRFEPSSSQYQIVLSWSPNGQRLASEVVNQSAIAENQPIVTLFDCQSGKDLARFTAGRLGLPKGSSSSIQLGVPEWSPDGQHLLLLGTDSSGSASRMIVLGPRSLGG